MSPEFCHQVFSLLVLSMSDFIYFPYFNFLLYGDFSQIYISVSILTFHLHVKLIPVFLL